VSDETPRFRLIKGGKGERPELHFSTDHLLAIDAILRERLQPVTRFGWVIDWDGCLVSKCGSPVSELTFKIRELVGARWKELAEPNGMLTGVSVQLPAPDAVPCPLVLVRIEPMGALVATCAGDPIPADYATSLTSTAILLGPVFDAARVTIGPQE
jgi:hypothetical protein